MSDIASSLPVESSRGRSTGNVEFIEDMGAAVPMDVIVAILSKILVQTQDVEEEADSVDR